MDIKIDSDENDIKISLIPVERLGDVTKFVYKHFCPDEPITRSIGLCQPNQEPNIFFDEFVKESIFAGLMATNNEGKILGVRLGKIVKRGKSPPLKLDEFLNGYPQSAMTYGAWMMLMKIFNEIGYDVNNSFDELKCDNVYEGKLVVVDREARAKGLGTELVRRSMQLGKERGCEYQYLCATGEYSAKVFNKLGFSLSKEVKYKDIKFKNGEEVLKDTREHKAARILYKKL